MENPIELKDQIPIQLKMIEKYNITERKNKDFQYISEHAEDRTFYQNDGEFFQRNYFFSDSFQRLQLHVGRFKNFCSFILRLKFTQAFECDSSNV